MTTPPLNLGNYPVALGNRGRADVQVFGPSSPQQFPGPAGVSGASCSLTVANPNGANCLVMGGMSCYDSGSAAGAVLYQYVSIDGGGWQEVCHYYFNTQGVHQWCGTWSMMTGVLAPGSHTFQLGAQDANVLCNFDSNDTAFLFALEMP